MLILEKPLIITLTFIGQTHYAILYWYPAFKESCNESSVKRGSEGLAKGLMITQLF